VFVVTERLSGEGDGLRVKESDCQVHTVPLKAKYRLRVVGAIRKFRRDSARGARGESEVAVAPPSGRPEHKAGLLRRAVLSFLWLPDDELRFVLPALKVSRRLMREHRIDLVYTTSPPHSSHLIGLRLRSSADVRWVAEFRDPWTDQRTPNRVDHWFGPAEAIHRWLELRCLRAADHIVTVTESTRALLASRVVRENGEKVILALNGIVERQPRTTVPLPAPFRIVHAGTFYLDRDPRPFLHALAATRRSRKIGPADIQVDFVGRCRSFGGISVEAEVEALGLSDIVHFHDWMEPAKAQAIIGTADLLLLLACSQPLQVPNKLFDYLGSGVPVLAIVDSGGESERMLSSVGGQFVVPVVQGEKVSEQAIQEALAAAIDARHEVPDTNEKLLQEWSSAVQMERLATAIGA